jgi:predicted nuclease of predicted toxin-antitoxin system
VKLVADESVDRQIVQRLREDGHEVTYVAELDPGLGDELVLRWAREARALLLTADKDFGELIFRQHQASHGVILVRLAGLPPDRKAEIVAASVREYGDEMLNKFTVISTTALRIRPDLPTS